LPHQGNLEDFDSGVVNGEWKLEFIDVGQFGEGELLDWEIFFCSTAGIDCTTCEPGQPSISIAEQEYCQFDDAIVSDTEISLTMSSSSPQFYDTAVAVFVDDAVIHIDEPTVLATLSTGTYTVCGASYLSSAEAAVQDAVASGLSYGELLLAAATGDLCIALSQSCIDIVIVETPPVVTVGDTICRGTSIDIDGVTYTESGTYPVSTPAAGCDSVSFVELVVLEKSYNLAVTEMELSCTVLTSQISLDGISSQSVVSWSSSDGFIISDTNLPTITIGKPGTYIGTVVEGECQFTEVVTITGSDDYLFAIVQADTLSCSTLEVTATLQVEGLVDSVVWSSTNPFTVSGDDIITSVPGLYSVDIYAPTCETTRFINVVEDTGISNITAIGDTISCDSTTATIAVELADAGEYSYQWFFNSTLQGTDSKLTTTDAGLYEAIVTADNGCTDTVMIEVVNDNIELEVQLSTPTISCQLPEVILSYTANADADESTTTWTLPTNDNVISDDLLTSIPGDYALSILTRGGCTFDTTFVVEADTLVPNLNVLNTTFPCGADSLRLNLTGASAADSISWVGDSFTSAESDPWVFAQGTYIVTVVPANGCVAVDTVLVDADSAVPNVELNYGELNCTNSEVTIVPADTVNFEFEWTAKPDSIVTDKTLIVSEEGAYSVKITDTAGSCSGRLTFLVVRNEVDTLEQIMADTLTCTVSTALLTATSSIGIENYTWLAPSGSPLTDTSDEPSVSVSGTYTLEYTLANGCTGSDSVEVVEIASAPMIETTDGLITCTENSTELSATVEANNYTVTWQDPSGGIQVGDSIQTTIAGEYQVVVVAEGNCTDTVTSVVVADTLAINAALEADGSITCLDAIVEVSAAFADAPTTVAWSGPAIVSESETIIAVSEPGIYTVETTGSNGCTGATDIEVLSEVVMPMVISQTDTITCDNPIATLTVTTVSSQDEINWADIQLTGFETGVTEGGTYSYTVSNPEGCTVDGSLTVPVDTIRPMPVTAVSDLLTCSTLEVDASITNPEAITTYEWNGPAVNSQIATSITVSQPGVYTVLASNPNGCFSVAEVTVDQDIRTPQIEALGDSITCNAGKSILNVSSDIPLIAVEWTGANMYFSTDSSSIVIEEGTYYVSVVAENGCTAEDSVEIRDVQVFPEVEIEDFFLPCDGAPALITPAVLSDGASMRWIGPGIFEEVEELATTTAGQYIGLAVTEEQCVSTDTFFVIDEAVPPIFDFRVDTLYCKGDVPLTAVDVDDDRSVEWISPDGTVLIGAEVLVGIPGQYNLIVTGENGCKDSTIVELPDGRVDPIVTIDLLDPFECLNQAVRLSAEGSTVGATYTYEWTTNNGIITGATENQILAVNGEGTYILTIREGKTGCSTTDSLVLRQEQQGFTDFEFEVTPPTCQDFANATVELSDFDGSFPPYQVYFDGSSYGVQQTIQYLSPGTYQLLVIDELGCEVTKVVEIEEGDYPEVSFPADTIIQLGDSILIEPFVFPDTIPLQVEWNTEPPCGPECLSYVLTPQEDLFLSVTVTDTNGCSDTDDFLITVSEQEIERFPNIFSPNDDGENDFFFLPYTKGIDRVQLLRIFNWNGTLVFRAEDIAPGVKELGWDGRLDGQTAMEGVYLVEAVLLLPNGSTTRIVTDLTLVR